VQDHGIGIPERDRARLFEAFHRASNVGETPGTGLGLLIVKRCVDMHHGTVAVQSKEGEGTKFTVRLPVYARSAE
jgi:signal transduction histidine kinase